MPGGSPNQTQRSSGVAASLNSLTLQPEDFLNIPRSSDPSGGQADITAHPGVLTGDGSCGISNVAEFSSANSYQRTIPDHVLANPEKFDDAPYVPPRVTQAELQNYYPALDPRLGNVYDPPNDIPHVSLLFLSLYYFLEISSSSLQQYPYEGGTSPSDSHHSVESNWSDSPSGSSASSQQLPHDYIVEPTSQYPQAPLPPPHTTYPQHYPAFHGQHRLGLGHVRYGEQPSNTGGSYYRTTQGYPLDGLLSPEIFEDTSRQVNISSQVNYPATSSQGCSSSASTSTTNHPPNVSMFPAAPTTLADSTRSIFPDAGPYLRQQLGLSAHESIGLQSLPDPGPGEKPSTPLPMLIKLAIYGSPNKQLTLQEIYTELENRFEWFREHKNQKAWKVRFFVLGGVFLPG